METPTFAKKRQYPQFGNVSIPHLPKMGKIHKCGNIYIEKFPHFLKIAKIGVSIIVSIPHCPTGKAQSVWNTNDDRYSEFGLFQLCLYCRTVWNTNDVRYSNCGHSLKIFVFCYFLKMWKCPDIASSVWNTNVRDVKCCVKTQKITGIPFVDQKYGFSLLQTLTYYISFY